jgi:AcrR family transcriptional regulator
VPRFARRPLAGDLSHFYDVGEVRRCNAVSALKAKAAGVAQGTLYRHFSSKGELLEARLSPLAHFQQEALADFGYHDLLKFSSPLFVYVYVQVISPGIFGKPDEITEKKLAVYSQRLALLNEPR